MSTLKIFLLITMFILVFAILLSFVRLIQGKTRWDRILMFNLISVKVVLFVSVYAIYIDNIVLLDIAISYGIIGFLTITLFSKFIMSREDKKC